MLPNTTPVRDKIVPIMPGLTPDVVEPVPQNLQAEEEYAAAVLADPYTVIATHEDVHFSDFHHGAPRAIVEAAWGCMDAQVAVTQATLVDHLQRLGKWGGAVNARYLDGLDDLGTAQVVRAARDNAAIVHGLSIARQGAHVAGKLEGALLAHPHDARDLLERAARRLLDLAVASAGKQRDPHVAAIGREAGTDPSPAVLTGLRWVDMTLGGFRPARLFAVQGQQKGRKTTFISNLLYEALKRGSFVSWFVLDNTRLELRQRFIAMAATEILMGQDASEALLKLDDEWLPERQRSPEQHAAIRAAEALVDSWSLRIYDSADGVQRLDVMERRLHRDCVEGCEFAVWDFAQKFKCGRRDARPFDHFEETVDRVQTVITHEKLTGIIAAQRNEVANASGGEVDGAGTKYGGALAAACDYLLDVNPVPGGHMRVQTRMARRKGHGEIEYRLNPSSGLILDPDAV